jgi:hypothetical protein
VREKCTTVGFEDGGRDPRVEEDQSPPEGGRGQEMDILLKSSERNAALPAP